MRFGCVRGCWWRLGSSAEIGKVGRRHPLQKPIGGSCEGSGPPGAQSSPVSINSSSSPAANTALRQVTAGRHSQANLPRSITPTHIMTRLKNGICVGALATHKSTKALGLFAPYCCGVGDQLYTDLCTKTEARRPSPRPS